jgi:hypothetical protein
MAKKPSERIANTYLKKLIYLIDPVQFRKASNSPVTDHLNKRHNEAPDQTVSFIGAKPPPP